MQTYDSTTAAWGSWARSYAMAFAGSVGLALWAASGVRAEDPALASLPPLPSSMTINDADPESSVPDPALAAKAPLDMGYLMMELSDRAEAAKQKKDYAQAAKYYRAIAKAVPDRAVAFSKACEAHEAAGQKDEAYEMCRAALGRAGVKADDLVRFVHVALNKGGALSGADVADIDSVIEQLRTGSTTRQGNLIADELDCELSLRLHDVKRARACVASLKKHGGVEAQVVAYEWALAVMEQDARGAEDIVERAKKMGLPKGVVDSMEAGLGTMLGGDKLAPPSPGSISGLPLWLPIAVMAALALGAAALVLLRRSRSAS